MKRIFVLAICLSLPITASAQPWYKSKKFWAGEAVIGLSIFLDYHSTAMRHGYPESSPLLGTNPSNGRIAGIGIGDFIFESGIHVASYHLMHNDPNKYWRFAGYTAQPAISFGVHVPAAVHNYGLPKR